MKFFNEEWLKAAFIRALRTMAQVALGYITVGMTIKQVEWKILVSTAIVAGLYSLLTSVLTGLPEVGSDGTFIVDNSDETKTRWTLKMDVDPEDIPAKKSVKLDVKNIHAGGER